MLLLHALGLLALVSVSAIGPGLVIVRPLRWTPLETLVGAIAASLLVVFLCGFGCFVGHAGSGVYWAISGGFAALTLLQARRIGRLLSQRAVRSAVAGYTALAGWCFLLLCCVRHYGGHWVYDWGEHYQRTQLFLGQLPLSFRFINMYALPARPPMMNVLAAFYCQQVGIAPQGNVGPSGVSFEIFSLTFLLLNTFAFLPCCLFARRFAPGSLSRRRANRGGSTLLLLLMALNPSVVENATFTWTKFLSFAYAVLAIYLYLRGWRAATGGRANQRAAGYTVAAFVCLAVAMLVHFSAAPYVVAIGVHYLWRLLRGAPGATIRVTVAIIAASGSALAPWFGWSASVFGIRTSLLAYFQTAATDVDVQRISTARRILGNLYRTFVPYSYHAPLPTIVFGPDKPIVYFSDYWFTLAQSNPIFVMGSVGGVVVVGMGINLLLLRLWSRGASAPHGRLASGLVSRGEAGFWLWLIFVLLTLGEAASGFVEVFGSGRLCFPPLLLIGIALLAARLPTLPGLVRVAILLGVAADLSCGILLHFWLQDTIFSLRLDHGTLLIDSPGYGPIAAANWWTKRALHVIYWGDHAAPYAAGIQASTLVIGIVGLTLLMIALFRHRRAEPAAMVLVEYN